MSRFLSLRVFVVALCLASPGYAQEVHLQEAGSGPMLSRSAFAHGYRHGYEEGYHLGNLDINMGRPPRSRQKAQFRGVKFKPGYSSSFGSKSSFEDGFNAGIVAGYDDGYAGQPFRAVDALRLAATAMAASTSPQDPSSANFDQGVAAGYRDGHQQEGSATPESLDFRKVVCVRSEPDKEQNPPAAGSYCEGYQRGYILGQADALALRGASVFLEASK
jgi:hypothetical protein